MVLPNPRACTLQRRIVFLAIALRLCVINAAPLGGLIELEVRQEVDSVFVKA